MNQVDYLVYHCIPTGWQTIGSAFRMWKDLMIGNYADYALLKNDDPFEECRDWFWATLGADEVLPKAFLEDLQQMIERIENGSEVLVEMNIDRIVELDKILEEFNDGDV